MNHETLSLIFIVVMEILVFIWPHVSSNTLTKPRTLSSDLFIKMIKILRIFLLFSNLKENVGEFAP